MKRAKLLLDRVFGYSGVPSRVRTRKNSFEPRIASFSRLLSNSENPPTLQHFSFDFNAQRR
jgi:hypothetical protein